MTVTGNLQYRQASLADAGAVAALHADSWRRNYRGAYSDAFLDDEVEEDRLAVWTERLARDDLSSATILAEEGSDLIGFAHVVFGADPDHGALLDNLHVRHGYQRRGVGAGLMAEAARSVLTRARSEGLFLWVLDQNSAAQAFYEAMAGIRADRRAVQPPGWVAGRLNGQVTAWRYCWPDPSVLVRTYSGSPRATGASS